ncbi:hypothetical protein [Aquimarina sp. MMG016]|uniref:hypothetical protein n=1 Tax=Aquimarina sp. MMG016 TaxID=2822690 RepID=UPI001B39EBA4|nr:hypothetical protein [Aquimarina sp. MMG016]MBQ4822886.1 hypothetical protein [Aquimarina sp. MMG016]
MRLNVSKNIISLFFVSAFLFLRVVNTHAFSHFSDDDHQTDCELCEIIITSNHFTPFTGDTLDEIKQKSATDYQEYAVNFGYETPEYCVTLPKSVYNKPPPVL